MAVSITLKGDGLASPNEDLLADGIVGDAATLLYLHEQPVTYSKLFREESYTTMYKESA